ncbi:MULTISPECIES: hypothetical protein [unclassified Streptomyces]|uniref:hypothetical protein n=1 Tax=unclassified Streptomyces TaxID=2593676 RepID=UPI002DDC3937|nr:hypothetical protein [Streptomyces sp. NBC_01237]WRZ78576.1 hypothetical protein OG251_43965 [Streptomyces sp. NBC_01237]
MLEAEGGPVMAPPRQRIAYQPPERAYLAYLGHTLACDACRTGAQCATAARLGRAWREARR